MQQVVGPFKLAQKCLTDKLRGEPIAPKLDWFIQMKTVQNLLLMSCERTPVIHMGGGNSSVESSVPASFISRGPWFESHPTNYAFYS